MSFCQTGDQFNQSHASFRHRVTDHSQRPNSTETFNRFKYHRSFFSRLRLVNQQWQIFSVIPDLIFNRDGRVKMPLLSCSVLLFFSLHPRALIMCMVHLKLFKSSVVCDVMIGWLGSRVVSVLDSGAEGPGFKSQSQRCRATVLGKLFTPIVTLFTKQQKR